MWQSSRERRVRGEAGDQRGELLHFPGQQSWDSYNEDQTMQAAVERYRARFGYNPKKEFG